MNERIKKLALQAGFETNGVICSFGNYKVDNEYFFAEDFIEDELAKFAELIVEECINVCKSRVGNSDYNTGRLHCVSDLKEHFGVEE